MASEKERHGALMLEGTTAHRKRTPDRRKSPRHGRAGLPARTQMGGMQFQRLPEGAVGLRLLSQAKLPQTDEVIRVGLTHTLARLVAELGEVIRACAFRKLFFAGPDQALKDRFGFARAAKFL